MITNDLNDEHGISLRHAERLLATCRRRAQAPRVLMALAVVFGVFVTAGLSALTFSALALFLTPVVAVLVAFVVHSSAIVAIHVVFLPQRYRRSSQLLLAALLSVVAFVLAAVRASLYFEGNSLVGVLVAVVEPAALWVTASITSRAHAGVEIADDYVQRSRDVMEAASAEGAGFEVWRRTLNHVDEERAEVVSLPADATSARQHREYRTATLDGWRRLVELHAPPQLQLQPAKGGAPARSEFAA